MSGRQQIIRLFLQERLTLAAEEIFGVVEKSISEYEEQVVQSKREVEQLKQHILTLNTLTHLHLGTMDSQPVSEELLPFQQLNPRQELMSSQEDEAVQRQSPPVKEEQVDLSIIPHSETSIYNIVTNGFVTSEVTRDSQLIPSYTPETVQQSPQVKEEQVDLIPDPETSISNIVVTNGFVNSESTRDSRLQNICRFCCKRFHSCSDMAKHVKESHIRQKAFKCPECDKAFTHKENLTDHYRIHTVVKPHSCPVCGKLFTQRSTVKIHMRTHTGDKPHSCPVCGKLFTHSSTVKVHMRTHTGEKPHSCPVCGKLFTHLSTVKVHMAIHTGDKPHSCPVCGKLFAQRPNLKVHMRTHTGEKPYFCSKCDKMVAHSTHLKKCEK